MQRAQFLKDSFLSLDVFHKQIVIGTAVAAGVALLYIRHRRCKVQTIPIGEGWWGAGKRPQSEDDNIYPFEVQTSEDEIKDLHERLDKTRYTDPLEDEAFQYGFNSTYLKRVTSYWRHEFDWKKQVAVLNKYPHFKTKIEGIDVHFIHVRPVQRKNQKVIPLMLVHGWPGSFFEFYKILPLLTESHDDLAFEVVCPSIPGYGYSEAPHRQGFDSLAAARIFLKLMERLGFPKFYLQGGDWGSLITTNMAQMKPLCVKGLHLNMFMIRRGFKVLMSLLIGPYLPFLVGLNREDVRRLFPFFEKCVWTIMRESGYLHIQATKPDTVGCGVNNSPVGLAAYILEKFSTWTNVENIDLGDGGLERKFSLDDLLTNVMIYWTTGSMVSSMRFYKENLKGNLDKRIDSRRRVSVPTGLAAFPGELIHSPKSWAQTKYHNIVSYTFMPRGGHFAAFEEPQLLASDVIQFVREVEH
ncbi:epoxide hydrolase 1 isoform X2 [Corythoichthys intestinalis]|uniref:epoxide hydrolase 1 isoform X2 n=1 Tax=Corythoichthys intestinalis TaxID=161448 RepID=UPI0025A5D2D5|nr:epoxide hydrolase 1 isoform X2 [Corythoichthys intestinalis]XP_061794352.1 epoxide hydrolase 1-like [Nerophis lumbriciformis]